MNNFVRCKSTTFFYKLQVSKYKPFFLGGGHDIEGILIDQPRHTKTNIVVWFRILVVEHAVEVELHAGMDSPVEAEVEVALHEGIVLA